MSLLSIDIGSHQIKLLSARVSGRAISVKKALTVPTPPRATENGLIIQPDAVEDALRQALSSWAAEGRQAAIVINSPEIVAREVRLPKTSAKNIRTIVGQEMDAFLAEGGYTVEFFLQNQPDGRSKALAFALPGRVVESYRQLLNRVGLTPVALDIGPNSIRKLVCTLGLLGQDQEEVTVLADIGYDFITFTLFYRTNLIYSRCVRVDLHQGADFSAREDLDPAANQAYRAFLFTIGDEIQRILQFLSASEYKSYPAKVFLCGGGAHLPAIAQTLSEYLYTQVALLQANGRGGAIDAYLREYVNALGAQIRL